MSKKIIICCECSQNICKAFRYKGYVAFSNDIQDCYGGHPEWHIKDDSRNIDFSDFSFVIAHPPCTYLSKCQPKKLFEVPGRYEKQYEAADFFRFFYNLNVDHLCIENPIPLKSANLPKYDQIIQPYYFGHEYSKATCLWLKNLPPLFYSCICPEHKSWVLKNRNPNVRSKTFDGIAEQMALQWGSYLE